MGKALHCMVSFRVSLTKTIAVEHLKGIEVGDGLTVSVMD